jgi:hypothetical protein
MTTSAPIRPGTAPRRRVRGARVLRALNGLLTLMVLLQAVYAGQFLGGDAAMRTVHGASGEAIVLLAMAQLVAALVVWRPGRGPGWPAVASALLLVALVVQLGLGWSGLVAVHVPLGVAIFGLAVALSAGTRTLTRKEAPA